MPVIRDPGGKKTYAPHPDKGFRSVVIPKTKPAPVPVFKPQTPTQELGVAPVTTHAPNQAPYKPGRAPAQVTTTRINRQRAASPVPQNPADPRVVQIQQHLRALGYGVAVDGVMGPMTRQAMAMSRNGTTPNFVYHPSHAQAAAIQHEARAQARHVVTNRNSFKPFYPGQKPDHFIEGPAPTSGAFGVGAPTRRAVYVLPHAGPSGDDKTGLNAQQQAESQRLSVENQGGLFPYVVKTGLESLVPHRAANALVNGHAPSAGDIASDAFNGALWLTPGTVAPALRTARVAEQALREEGITANALRTLRETRGAIRTAAEDADKLKRDARVARAEANVPIVSPVRDQIDATLQAAPGITNKERKALLRLHDVMARVVAKERGTTPEHAYELLWKGANFHDIAPTATELHGGLLAQTGREPEITNLSQTPEQVRPTSLPIERASRNLLRTARDAAPPHARTPKALRGLLEDLQRRAIEAADFRKWYAHSAAGIMEHVNHDVRAADKLAALIAVYSPRAEVYSKTNEWNNLDRAINAFDEFNATGEISPRWSISSHKTGEEDWQTFRAQQIMQGNFEWQGLKTNRFYRNFLQHIDSQKYEQLFGKERFGTMDTWMRRAFRYPVREAGPSVTEDTLFGPVERLVGKSRKDETITPKMYAFMERATKAVADSLGWSPEEAQAAIWTSIKAETEGTPMSQAGFDFRDAFLHREARRARPLDPEQLALSPETSDVPKQSAVDTAIEASRQPDSGFTLTAGLNPDAGNTGYVVAYGAYEFREPAPLTRKGLLDFRNKHLQLLRSNPSLRVGGWHNPDDGQVYLDISRVFENRDEAMKFAREQGQLAIYDRATGDVPTTGLAPEEADSIKAGLKQGGRLQERAAKYENMLEAAYAQLTGKAKKALTASDREQAERYVFDWIDKNPDAPETPMFMDLYHDAQVAGQTKDPELLFQPGEHVGNDLAGLPKGRSSNRNAQIIADRYMQDAGMPYHPPTEYARVDKELAARIADWYDKAISAPDDPEVRAAYQAMADETLAQYKAITGKGYVFEFYPEGADPYPSGPSAAIADLRDNKHMYVFPTDAGFGTENAAAESHPLLADSGETWGGKPVTHNDIFRAVHDFMGHFKEGVGFRADGEENAWRAHSAMYSPRARRAMTSETRGQNSWVNFGPHGEANRTADQASTVYADQKAVLAPDWIVHEGSGSFVPRVKGAVERTPDGATLHLFRGADVSTALHEMAHAVEPLLPDAERAGLRASWEASDKSLNYDEFVARSVERYFMEGKAPTKELRKTFRTLAEGMAEVYGHASRIPGSQLTPELARAFDRFFVREGRLDPRWATHAVTSWLAQEGSPDPMLEAAAMQVTQGGMSPEDAAKMFGQDLDALKAHIQEGHAAEQARILSNADVGAGAAETTTSAEDIFKKWNLQEEGSRPYDGLMPGDTFTFKNARGQIEEGFIDAGGRPLNSDGVRLFDSRNPGALDDLVGKLRDRASEEEWLPQEEGGYPSRDENLANTHRPLGNASREAEALAARHGVEPGKIEGTGANGLVTVGDVEKYVFEQMSPEDQLRSITRGLKIARGKQDAGYSIERRARFAAAENQYANENLSPEERLAAGKGELAGELPKVTINGRARDMSQDALDHLLLTTLRHPTLMTGQKTTVADALIALVKEGRTPTKREIALMQHVWGKDTVASLQEIASNWHKGANIALSALNIPRSIMSSMDVSFGMRQALVAGFYDPKTWWSAYRQQFQYLSKWTGGGEKAYQALLENIHAKPNFPMYQEMKLAITDLEHEIGLREEPYQSNLAERATYKGHGPGNLVRGSGRAYTGMGITLRTELADKLLAEAASRGQDIHNQDFLRELGHFINGITGRGDLPGKVLQESAPLLNALFFSPRLLASRIQMLNPRNYIAGDKFVRRQYLRAGLRTFGTLATILGTIKMFAPGAKVGTDWRSADFGKVKIGNTRIDLGGGFNQLFHLMGMIYTGQKMSSTSGKVTSLTSNKFGQATRADAFVNFLSGKLAPVPSMVNDWAKNRDPQHVGQPFNWKDEAASHFEPLIIQDAWQLYNDPTAGMNGIEAAAAGYGLEAQGVGIQTYKAPDVGAKSSGKLQKTAKAAGFGAVPKDILIAVDHKANLDSISASDKGDPQARLKDSIAYYSKTTGRHDFDRLLTQKVPDEVAANIVSSIRDIMVGPGLSAYESAVKTAAEAKGVKVK